MAFKRLDEYVGQRKNYPYPSQDINPSLKREKEYFIAVGHAIMGDFTNNVCELPYAFDKDKRTFKELHEYATGTYPNTKLKSRIIGESKKKNGRYITKMNISWDTFPVISKMMDVMREKNMRQEYAVDAICIDQDSIKTREKDKGMLKYLIRQDAVELMIRTGFRPNVPLDPQVLGIQTEQDVDLYFDSGQYTFQREIVSIAVCNKTKQLSNYKVIQDQTFDDLIKYGIEFWKTVINPATGEVTIRKVDMYNPELGRCNVIVHYSQSNNFENMSMFGEIRTLTIAEMRKQYPRMTAEELIYAAKSYTHLNAEFANYLNGWNFYQNGSYNLDPISRCKVLVLEYQWLDVDIENYLKNDSRNFYKSVDFDFNLSAERKRKGDRQIQKRVVKKFDGHWLIGTDMMLKQEIASDVVYYGPDGDKCPSLDYFGTKTGNGSLIERAIAIQDDIDLANIKLRNTLSSAIPAPRMVIQQALLDNVFLNGIKLQPQDNFATLKELGYLFVNAFDDDGKPIFPNQKLIDFLPSGIQEDINVFTGQIVAGISNLRELFGLAQGADGSTPQKYDGFKKTSLAQQQSNAALFPTFNCFQYLFEATMDDVVKKWQITAKDRKMYVAHSKLGNNNYEMLALDEDFTNADLNISMVLGATDEQINQLLQDITQLRALGIQTQFTQGITTSEYIFLNETIRSGNTKQAMWVMAKIEQKKIAAQQLVDQQNQQNNALSQQNSAAQAELNRQQTETIKAQEQRKTKILSGAVDLKTQVSSSIIKDFVKEGAQAEPLYQQMIQEANQVIVSILQQDNPQLQNPTDPTQQPPQQPQQNMQQQQEVA